MAISIVATSKTITNNNAMSGTFALPTGIQNGDIIILGFSDDSDGALDIALPGAWTLVEDAENGSFGLACFWKLGASADSGANVSYTSPYTGIEMAFTAVVLRGAASSPVDVHSQKFVAGGGASCPSTSVTTTQANDFLLVIFGANWNGTMTLPTGLTDSGAGTNSTANYAEQRIGYAQLGAAGATTAYTATVNSGSFNNAAIQVAIETASAAAPVGRMVNVNQATQRASFV